MSTDKTHDEMKKELMDKNVGWDFQKQKSKIPRMKKDKLEMLYKFDKASNNFGDISIINPNDLPDFDYFTYSFPCQDISVSGKQNGIEKGKTRSGLLYECEKIIETKKPKYLLMENVKNLVSKKFINDFNAWLEYLESLGYKNYWKVLNAKNFGIAQNRERVFCVSILGEEEYEFPQGFKLEKRLKDFLEDSIEEKYYLSEEIQNRFKQTKVDNGENNVIGTTAPEFRTIGQRDLVYGNESCANGTLVATDYKQPKQIIDYETDKLMIVGNTVPSEHTAGRIFDVEGVSPTVMYRNAKVVQVLERDDCSNGAIRGRYNDFGEVEQQLELRNDGVVNTITTVQKDNVVVELNDKEKFKYKPSGENVIGEMGGDLWEKRHEQTRRVYDVEKISPTIPTCSGGGQHPEVLEMISENIKPGCREQFMQEYEEIITSEKDIYYCNAKTDFSDKKVGINITPCIRANNHNTHVLNNFRIRKLTPTECLRLMGLSDKDINKIKSTGLSDSSLYKLAGNSIVKQCLDYIHINLFKEKINNENNKFTPS